MNTVMPLVSVIIPSYNHEKYVVEAIMSVLAQDYTNLELVVVDDNSTDNSVSLISDLLSSYNFKFIRNNRNLGINASINIALSNTKGEYVSFLASDDIFVPNKISEQISYILENNLHGLYSTGYKLFENSTKLINLDMIEKLFNNKTILNHVYINDTYGPLLQSGLFEKKVIKSLMEIRNKFKSDDWATLIVLLERYNIGFLNKPYFYYRIHQNNTYKNYWATLPMRLEVVCCLTPEQLRLRAFSNILENLSISLLEDYKLLHSVKFLIAAKVINFRLEDIPGLFIYFLRLCKRIILKRKNVN